MSYNKEIMNKIDLCFESQLDRIREFKKEINSVYEKIIYALENDNDVQAKCHYSNVYVSDDRLEYEVIVSVPITDSICSTIRSLFKTIDPKDDVIDSKSDYTSELVKKNIEYGKNYLNTKFKEYFSKCNFEYTNSIIRIADRKLLEMHFIRKEYYSTIV